MKRFQVFVRDVVVRLYEVEADTAAEAKRRWENGDITCGGDDVYSECAIDHIEDEDGNTIDVM
jgi:hypothetical protein